MRGLGFATLLADEWLSPIITTFHAPADPAFEFDAFYDAMKARGFIIYPGKLTAVDSFSAGPYRADGQRRHGARGRRRGR